MLHIHPEVLTCYLEGTLVETPGSENRKATPGRYGRSQAGRGRNAGAAFAFAAQRLSTGCDAACHMSKLNTRRTRWDPIGGNDKPEYAGRTRQRTSGNAILIEPPGEQPSHTVIDTNRRKNASAREDDEEKEDQVSLIRPRLDTAVGQWWRTLARARSSAQALTEDDRPYRRAARRIGAPKRECAGSPEHQRQQLRSERSEVSPVGPSSFAPAGGYALRKRRAQRGHEPGEASECPLSMSAGSLR